MALNGYADYLAINLQNHFLVSTWTPVAASLWVGLSLTVPNPDGTGFSEPTVGDYARENSATMWGNAASIGGTPPVIQSKNVGDITFTTASVSWGTVVAAAVFDAQPIGTGNMLFGGELVTPKLIQAATQPVFLTDAFKVSTANQS